MQCKSFGKISPAFIFVVGASLGSPTVFAQARYQFDLPAQSVADSLQQVGRVTGTNILFDLKSVAGKSAKATKGPFTTEEAIAQIIEGTRLEVRRTGDSTLVIKDQVQKQSSEKPQTSIAAKTLIAAADADSAPTQPPASRAVARQTAAPLPAPESIEAIEVKGKFLATGASSAMKLDIPVRDTPFSVAAYTDSFMKAIETANVADLYKYMTGIQRAGATAFDMSIRGFKTASTDRNAIMVDGLPGLAGRFASPPTISTDHIEVVKGPAAVLYGQAQPGGFVNIIPKKPSARASAELDLKLTAYRGNKLTLGDATGYDYAVDITGPIDADKTLLYRFIAENNDTNTFRDFTYTRGPYLSPSFTWKISDATSATAVLEYRKTKTSYDKGLVPPNRDISRVAPITTLYQQPGDTQQEIGSSGSLAITHRFDNDFKLNFSSRVVESKDKTNGYDNAGLRADLVTLQRRATQQVNTRESAFWDLNVVMPFSTAFIEHKMIIGVNGGRDTADANRVQFFAGPATGPQSLDINIYNPVYSTTPPLSALPAVTFPVPNPNPQTDRYTVSRAIGAYAADLMTLSENWKLNLGARTASESQAISDRRLPFVPVSKTAKKVLPLAGLLYQPTDELTFYTSYSTSFVPAAATSVDINGNNPFKPETSKQYEVGAKADLLDGKLQPTLAVFRINKKDTLSTFNCVFGTCTQQIGAERSQGIEFELNAQPVENWQIALGASHIDPTIIASSDLAQVGAQLVNAAKNNAHIWSRYDFKRGYLSGFGFGVGVSYISDRAGNLPSTPNPRVIDLPAFTVADLGAYYTYRNLDFTFKIGNVFDKLYYEATGATADVQLQPGAPRNVALSMRAHF